VRIGWSTGYRENYWRGWPWIPMYGGSERIVAEMAREFARRGHSVTVRLPYSIAEKRNAPTGFAEIETGVRWISDHDEQPHRYDLLFCADDFDRKDEADRTVLVACRSDPPPRTDFDEMVFLSRTHAELMGHPTRPFVGGGVDLADYRAPLPRVPRRVICTSSPDRCAQASAIGAAFDFVHTYRPVGGVGHEYTRDELLRIQKTAMVQIYPLDPRRPSDMYSMSVLEALAAGTPVITSDADAMPECWGDAALVLPRPIDLGAWVEATEGLLTDRWAWAERSRLGRLKAKDLTWERQAARLLAIALPGLHRA
jgi:glycosyltransferase involved in cell wall biosynthesis